jgi:hypothetical protein
MAIYDATFLGICLLQGIFALLLAGACGAPLVCLVNEAAGRLTGRKFLDKFAQQMARMGIWCSCLWLLLPAASMGVLAAVRCPALRALAGLPQPVWIVPAALYGAGLLLNAVYFSSWRALKNVRPLHLVLALLSAIGYWGFLYVLQNIATGNLLGGIPLQDLGWRELMQPVSPTLAGTVLGQFLILALGGSGALGLGYLLKRRSKDDFGRDYYRSAVTTAARWSLFYPCQILFLGWMYGMYHLAHAPGNALAHYSPLAGSAVLLGAAATLWVAIMRSRSPLRLKGTLVMSLVLGWLGLCATFAGYAALFSGGL